MFTAPGQTAPAGLLVELLDAGDPFAPRIVATAATAADGQFSMADTLASLEAPRKWLRVTLPNNTVLRSFATAVAYLTPGSEAALREVTRLIRSGGLSASELSAEELRSAQDSLSLYWEGAVSGVAVEATVGALLTELRTHSIWNRFLDSLAATATVAVPGDIAGLVALDGAKWQATVTEALDGVENSADRELSHSCFPTTPSTIIDGPRFCGHRFGDQIAATESLEVTPLGLRAHLVARTSQMGELSVLLGRLELVEFPYRTGVKTLLDRSQIDVRGDGTVLASVKVRRHTYPIAWVSALGATVRALPVITDFEIVFTNTQTKQTTEILQRERRWFTPLKGKVRTEIEYQQRVDKVVSTGRLAAVVNLFTGATSGPAVEPFAGVADVQALPLRHRHATYSPVLDRIFVAVASAGGQVLELDPRSMAVLRIANTGVVPGRLAVARDGSRLYVGLDGGRIGEYRLSDLVRTRLFDLPLDPYGRPYDRVYDLSVDPFDAERVLVMGAMSTLLGGNPVMLVYRSGALVMRDAPRYNANSYGWGYYNPTEAAWTTVPDEFIVASNLSPPSMYRFRLGTASVAEIAALERTESVGEVDVAGRVVTSSGRILDASTFSAIRVESLPPFAFNGCLRLDSASNMCQINSGFARSPFFYVHFDAADGRFLGTYRPDIRSLTNGCPEVLLPQGSLGLVSPKLTAFGDGRTLASSLPDGNGSMCALFSWSLRGAY